MANGIFRLGKQSGGTLGLVFPDGVSDTEVVLPESGELASKEYADTKISKVTSTDNAIVRFDGTSGEVQNSGVIIDDDGGIGTYGAQFNTYSYNGGTNSFEFVQRTAGKGFLFYVDGASKYGMKLDEVGNLLLLSGTGALGYGAGAGGTVTQLTSKTASVTLNKPSGKIIMSNSSLAAGATAGFAFNNNLIGADDKIEVEVVFSAVYYHAYVYFSTTGVAYIAVENKGFTERTDTFAIKFVIIKGATA